MSEKYFGVPRQEIARLLFKAIIHIANDDEEFPPEALNQCHWDDDIGRTGSGMVLSVEFGDKRKLAKYIEEKYSADLESFQVKYNIDLSRDIPYTLRNLTHDNKWGLTLRKKLADYKHSSKRGPKIFLFKLVNLPSKDLQECLEELEAEIDYYNQRQKKNKGLTNKYREDVRQEIFGYSNVRPKEIPEFIGRAEDLEAIHSLLTDSRKVRPIVVLSGMGGIGKTQIASEYGVSWQCAQAFKEGRAFIDVGSHDSDTLIAALVSFAVSSGHSFEEGMEPLDKLSRYFARAVEGKKEKTLIIFDNVNSLLKLQCVLPPSNNDRFAILVTTRSNNLGNFSIPAEHHNLEILKPNAAVNVLASYLGQERIDSQRSAADDLVNSLGCLPLAIVMIGGYLRSAKNLKKSLSETQNEIQRMRDKWKPGRDGAIQHRAFSDEDNPQLSLIAVFNLTWQSLKSYTKKTAKYLTIFPPTFIDWNIVREALKMGVEQYDDQDFEREDESLGELLQFNMLNEVEGESDVYACHSLIGDFFQSKRGEDDPDWIKFLEDASVKVAIEHLHLLSFNSSPNDFVQFRNRKTFFDKAYKRPEVIEAHSLEKFFYSYAYYYQREAAFAKAIEIGNTYRSFAKESFGEEHLDVANSLNSLAILYKAQGRYSEAEPLYQQALELRQQLLGLEHPAVTTSLNNLAEVYRAQGRYSEAEPLYQQALELMQRLLGLEHPDVATSFNNLAGLYKAQGRYSEAEPLYQQALELSQRLLGLEHPDVATSFNNLAGLYKAQGRYSEAEPLYQQALELMQRLLGLEHPDVASSLSNLAELYRVQGRYSEAQPLYQKSLDILDCHFGREHPFVPPLLNNIALLNKAVGRYAEAEKLYIEALDLSTKLLGRDHPEVTSSVLNNLAGLYDAQERYNEAEPLYIEALEIRYKALGNEHPYTTATFIWLHRLYRKQSKYDKLNALMDKYNDVALEF